nr:unnamed protein product [Digitaria exilis]
MTASADDGTSPAPTVTEGETPAAAGAGAAIEESEGMKGVAATTVEEHDEVEPEEDPEEQVEDEEDVEGDAAEVEPADGMEATLVKPLAVLKPGEEDEPEELEGEKEELDEEPEEARPSEEEPEELVEEKQECNGVEEKGAVDESAANDMNEVSKQEHGKCGNINMDKVADQLIKVSDNGASKSNDAQNSELDGGLELFVDGLPKDCAEEDIAVVFSQSGEVKSVRIIKNSSTGNNKDIALVCYVSIEAAKKALTELKEGIEVKGEKAKKVYLEHVPLSWDEDKIKERCQQYGKIMKVELFQISKNMESETFSFVEFSSSKSALACVEGINNANIVEEGFKVMLMRARKSINVPKNLMQDSSLLHVKFTAPMDMIG